MAALEDAASRAEGNAAYYRVPPRARLLVGVVYRRLLIAACAIGMDVTFVDRSGAI